MCLRKIFLKLINKKSEDYSISGGLEEKRSSLYNFGAYSSENIPTTMRKGTTGNSYTVSHGTGHHLFLQNGTSPSEFEPTKALPQQMLMPPLVPPKKRNSTTLTLRNKNSNISNNGNSGNGNGNLENRTTSYLAPTTMGPSTLAGLNPKRVSVATSSFWDGHPDVGHLVRGWELGLDGSNNRPGDRSSLWGSTFDPSKATTTNGNYDTCTLLSESNSESLLNTWGDPPAVKKGVLLQQRDKLLARWKERYCILTRDYLHCFRRTSSIHRSSGLKLSEMGNFIFKLRLAEIDEIEWESRRNCSVLIILLPNEPKILVRVPGDNAEILRQWYTLLQECIYTSKERRTALRNNTSTTISSRSVMSLLSDGSSPTTSGCSTGSRSNKSGLTTATSHSSSSCSSGPPSPANDHGLNSTTTSRGLYDNKTDMLKKKNAMHHQDDEQHIEIYDENNIPEKVILRRDLKKNKITGQTTTAEDFMKHRASSTFIEEDPSSLVLQPPKVPSRKSTAKAAVTTTTIKNSTSNNNNSVVVGNGYSIPIDFKPNSPVIISYHNNLNKKSIARRVKRPESWAPAANSNESFLLPPSNNNNMAMAYRAGTETRTTTTANLVPSHHWLSSTTSSSSSSSGQRNQHYRNSSFNFNNNNNSNNNNNNSSGIINTTPSIHTSEISFRKIC